jgi:hypothetical protein
MRGNVKPIIYLAHPVRGIPRGDDPVTGQGGDREQVLENLANVKAWIRWLFLNDPSRIYIAPWVAEVEAFMETGQDADPDIVERALADDCEIVRNVDGLMLVGGRISAGMQLEMATALKAYSDYGSRDYEVMDWSDHRSPHDVLKSLVRPWTRSVSW